jgi:asparagine synthase (glutamine-hydrolysing)
MCGIAGIFRRDGAPVNPGIVAAMSQTLNHRGPDDSGIWNDGCVAFGHRRLAIRDIGPGGHQPISDPSGGIWVTYNGEIYNDAALRRELSRDFGCTFRTTCDAETVPLAYRHWGPAAFERFEGMFAIALWDTSAQRLFLVRDGVGIKPLFYSDDGRAIRFASEIKALLADPEQPRRLSPLGLHRYFAMGYVGPDATTLEDIHQVPPGTILSFDAEGQHHRQFWQPRRDTFDFTSVEDAATSFTSLWEEVVDDLMISDVPVGVLQSGGVDSSLVTLAVAHKHKVPVFTAGFSEASHDESAAAREVAAMAGLEQDTVPVDHETDVAPALERIVHHFDGQVCDESAIPLFLLLRKVRQRVKVVLSGDGGDEFFGGYVTYRASRIAAGVAPFMPQQLSALIGRLAYSVQAKNETRLPASALLARFALGLADGRPQHAHTRWRRLIPGFQLADIYGSFLHPVADTDPFENYARELDDTAGSVVDRCLVADQRYHLPAGVLMKADAMSMAHSLELRVPLLDRRVMEFAGRCRADLLSPAHGPTKRLLRSVLRRYKAPDEIVRGRKRGFNTPIAQLLRTSLRALAQRHFAVECDRLAPFFDPGVVRRCWLEHIGKRANHAYTLWPILTFAIWLEQIGQQACPPIASNPALQDAQ